MSELIVPTLTSERLVLRPFRESDLDEYADIVGDPEVMHWVSHGKPKSRVEAWLDMAFKLGHWKLRGSGQWAIERRDDQALLGRSGFYEAEGWPGFELTWLLGRPFWGHGYATESACAARDFAFDRLGRDRLISLIDKGNQRSARVALRVGEAYEGIAEVDGDEVDLWSMDRERWEQVRAGP